MPLPLTVSFFSKIQIGFTFLVPAHLGGTRKRAVKQMCVCVLHSIECVLREFFRCCTALCDLSAAVELLVFVCYCFVYAETELSVPVICHIRMRAAGRVNHCS